MNKLQTKKEVIALTLLSVLVYFCSYLVRINYAAIIVELIASGTVTKTQTAAVTTVAFITYGVGQLVSGVVGDKFSPRLLIFWGFTVTVLMNFLMPLSSHSFILMSVIWGINGIAQAFMWPPLAKIMTSAMTDADYTKSVPFIGIGSALATIIVYLLSPFIIKYLGWQYVFYLFGAFAFICSFIWLIGSGKMLRNINFDLAKKVKEEKTTSASSNILMKLLPVIMLTIAIQGVLRDGITTWMPSLMSDSFNMKSTTSILTAVGLPIFHVMVNLITYKFLLIFRGNVFRTITAYFAAAIVMLTAMFFFGIKNMWMAILLLSAAMGIIHGINSLQTAYVPKYFTETGSVSTVAGMLNFATYVGSAVSTYLFAVISDKFGWNITILFWIIFATAGTLITSFIDGKYKNKKYR